MTAGGVPVRQDTERHVTRSGGGSERGNKARTRPIEALEAATREFCGRLKRDFESEVTRWPRDFKAAVVRLIRRYLPPRRGRPRDPRAESTKAYP